MKKASILFIIMFFFVQNCTSQQYISKENLSEVLAKKEYSFVAQRAHPTNFDVINVINSMPNAASSRILNLDSGYTIDVKGNELEVVLPYFGRNFNPSRDTEKQSLRFTSKDFSYEEKEGKKSKKIISIKPKDINNINEIIIEIASNGKAYASFSMNDRQPISFDGYLAAYKKN